MNAMNPSANVQTENVQTANVPANASHTQVAQTFKPILIKPTDANMRRRLQRKVARDSMTQPVRGLYADSQLWNSLSPNEKAIAKIYAIARLHPHWPVSSVSAAALLGATCDSSSGPKYLENVHFAADEHTSTANRKRLPIKFHYAKFSRPTEKIDEFIERGIIHEPEEIVLSPRKLAKMYIPINEFVGVINGILVTSPKQTIFDCMRRLPFEDALKICDKLAKIYHISYRDMVEFIRLRAGCWKNIATLFKLKFVDGKSENGGESFCRGRMIRGGFTMPILQKDLENVLCKFGINDEDALQQTGTIRPDFMWEITTKSGETGFVAAELDGREKYENPQMLANVGAQDTTDIIIREHERENILTILGIRVIRFSFAEAAKDAGARLIRKLKSVHVPMVDRAEQKRRKRMLATRLGEWSLMRL